jgi:hypothetical protein
MNETRLGESVNYGDSDRVCAGYSDGALLQQ